ncbi:MAG: Holliday junction resolvase RuvX [Coriobacteriia bacterium]|nr:Holliday junction resolvase RuvX [Coriobacteriia bacterium]MBN2839586.1 Holliday junction resolvase RuvX [Coriobacteriia bacterium]
MRALGLDIGSVRIGVAVSDPSGRVASPIAVLDARALAGDLRPLKRLVEDYETECLVVGLPLTLAGDEGSQAAAVRAEAERLARAVDLPVEYADERLSSEEARRSMAASGMSEKEQRGAVDKIAAAIILQGWLDARWTAV